MSHEISPEMAKRAATFLALAHERAIAVRWTNGSLQRGMIWYLDDYFKDAARELGYTLTPIVTPSPDSGRAKEIGDVCFEPHQVGGA